ncbi:conserved hypothetical protein [Magnetospirillum sp. UT-4]|nr:conserved hypothetical protein [Magnetospirillum sp. UT-4]
MGRGARRAVARHRGGGGGGDEPRRPGQGRRRPLLVGRRRRHRVPAPVAVLVLERERPQFRQMRRHHHREPRFPPVRAGGPPRRGRGARGPHRRRHPLPRARAVAALGARSLAHGRHRQPPVLQRRGVRTQPPSFRRNPAQLLS